MADALVVIQKVAKILWTIFLALLYSLEGLIWALIPYKFLKHKDVGGEVVLITGAGSGLGRMMALRFASLGSTLVLWDVNKTGNDETLKQIEALGGQAYAYVCNCSDNEEVYKVAAQVKEDVGDVTILINNAGVVAGKQLIDAPDNLIKRTMDVNVTAHFWTLKAFLPTMLARNHGHVVTIASLAGHFGTKGLVEYCASKFGAVGIDESLRFEILENNKTGVKTTVICPYFINTGMFDGVVSKEPWILPILEPEYVIDNIMEAVLTNTEMVVLPKTMWLLTYLKPSMPTKAMMVMHKSTGLDMCMDDFKGRDKQE
ncbi:epidermal retinol dehydrogenase 2-like isoform X1 [Amphiura filiformis]|uniref:epidermal retinol dehydrogenase 2-like isoform X1 n=1 Tax=Amphiura filiformis TaxID=82378 RepID=UPI003B2261B7